MAKTRRADIDINILKDALERTANKRRTDIEYSSLEKNLKRIFSNEGMQKLWKNYRKKFTYSKDIGWEEVAEKIVELFLYIKKL